MKIHRPTGHVRPAGRAPSYLPAFVVGLLCFLLQPSMAHAQTGARPVGKAQPLPDEYMLEQVGAWGGEVGAFVKEGDIGYVGAGQRLVVLDMSDLSNLVELGSVRLGSTVRDIKVRDDYAYVAAEALGTGHDAAGSGFSQSGFLVVDVHDPSAPQVVWGNHDPLNPQQGGFHGEGIELYDDLALLRGSRLIAADISDPLNPVMVADNDMLYDGLPGNLINVFNDFAVQGDFLYVAGQESLGFFRVYDLSTLDPAVLPMRPPLVGSVAFGQNREVTGVAVEGDWAYVAVTDESDSPSGNEHQAEVWAIDISDPMAPDRMGTFDDFPQRPGTQLWGLGDLSVSSGRLYVSNESDETPGNIRHSLTIFDVATDPGHPARLGTYNTHGSVFGVVGEGDIAYLFDHGEGLIAVDCANPAVPSPLDNFHSPATLGVMCKRGDLMYISDYWNGMTILDVSDKSNPQIVSVYQAEENLGIGNAGLALDDDGYAYLAAGSSGLDVIDISAPEHPTLMGRFAFPSDGSWRVAGVAVHENMDQKVAVLSFDYGPEPNICVIVMCLDVTNPNSINEISRTCAGGQTPKYFEQDGYGTLYSVGRIDSAHILKIDYSDPANMNATALSGSERELGGDSSTAMAFDHDRRILWHTASSSDSNTLDHLYAVNVADPDNPHRISDTRLRDPGAVTVHPQGLVLLGQSQDLLGHGLNSVLLMNTNDPSSPQLLGSAILPFPRASNAAGFSRSDVVADESGLYVARSFQLGDSNTGNTGLAIFDVRSTVDRNGDGRINTRDLAHFLKEVRLLSLSADINGDGRVDQDDVALFVRMYLS